MGLIIKNSGGSALGLQIDGATVRALTAPKAPSSDRAGHAHVRRAATQRGYDKRNRAQASARRSGCHESFH
jgi:hypothetical protein